MESKLKIIISSQFYNPHFDLPPEMTFKEFNIENGYEAELHFIKLKEQADKSGGMMHVSINIQTKNN